MAVPVQGSDGVEFRLQEKDVGGSSGEARVHSKSLGRGSTAVVA